MTSLATNPLIRAAMALQNALATLYEAGELCDFTIHVADSTWEVHKALLCVRSKYFERLFKGGDYKEALENKIELKEDEVEVVEAMIEVFYQGDYSYKQDEVPNDSALVFHAKVSGLNGHADSDQPNPSVMNLTLNR
jgi:hypothetical protein